MLKKILSSIPGCQSRLISSFVLLLLLFFVSGCEKELERESYSGPLFSRLDPQQTGVNFTNLLPPESRGFNVVFYQYLHNGGGVALGDINNDGLKDIFFTANFGDNKLYLNKGNMSFEDITQKAGLKGKWGWTTGSTMVDINGDGLLDIYVCKSGEMQPEKRKNEFYINQGNSVFIDMAEDLGLADESWSTHASFFDYDKDGDLDMFLLNHNIKPVLGKDLTYERNNRNPDAGDKLYRNDGGKFTDVSEEAGIIGNGIGYGLSVSVGDINNDGWQDMYVCNDYIERDYLYINNHDGTFSESAMKSFKHISNFSMGSDMADFNNDGLLDIMVVDMVAEDNYRIKTNMSGMSTERFYNAVNDGFHHQYMTNTLQLNNGDGSFSEVSQLAGVSNTDWSWAPLFADFDKDGHKDLFVTNGLRKEARNSDFVNRKKEIMEEMETYPDQKLQFIKQILDELPENQIQNYIYKNEGDLTFSNKREDWGLTVASWSNGAAYGDLDNDGDLDLVIANVDHPSFIYENKSDLLSENNSLNIKLESNGQNRSGIGARVTIKTEGEMQMQELVLSRGYQSSVPTELFFGLGNSEKVDSLWVEWPDGKLQLDTNVEAGQDITISYDASKFTTVRPAKKPGAQLFVDVTDDIDINYTHKENDYNDFNREILIPHKMSTQGPGMAVGDVNGDGLEDFYVGAARGSVGKLFIQNGGGTFSESNQSIWNPDRKYEDVSAVFFDAENDGDLDLYVVSGGNEVDPGSEDLQDRLYINDGTGKFTKSQGVLPRMLTSGGSVSPHDFDSDGDVDLFIGGRVVPGSYPVAPRSYLLVNENGKFEDRTAVLAPELENPGMVTSSIWVDIDSDGNKDLIIAGEWMPVMVMRNNGDFFSDVSAKLGLENTEGWWNSVAAADFDQDGDQDLVLGNLGENYKYKANPNETFDIYYSDFDNSGTGDIVLSYNEGGQMVPLRGRECSSQQMPFIKEKFKTYDAFGKATITDIYGEENLSMALHLQVKTFASVYIENNGDDAWSIHELPKLAQLSSVNGIVIRDLDKDGNLDMVLSGNLFESEVETPRNDASNGLVLLGDGSGGFSELRGFESGFYAPGNVKELHQISLGDRPHLAVVNNNDGIQIFGLKN